MIIDKIQRIISNKHARAATAVQQGCDACPDFNTLNGICKVSTAENLPMNGYKLRVSTKFTKAR